MSAKKFLCAALLNSSVSHRDFVPRKTTILYLNAPTRRAGTTKEYEMKILSLDQSTRCTGYCITVDGKITEYGTLTPDRKKEVVNIRMREMFFKIYDLVKTAQPNFIVFEGTQYQNNANSFNILSKLQGTILSIAFLTNLGFYIVEPTCWKSFCGVKGKKRDEQKADTKRFVTEAYGIIASEDEADAIGIATWAMGNITLEDERKTL